MGLRFKDEQAFQQWLAQAKLNSVYKHDYVSKIEAYKPVTKEKTMDKKTSRRKQYTTPTLLGDVIFVVEFGIVVIVITYFVIKLFHL